MIASLTPAIKALVLDMDGVLWKDKEPIGDLPAIFAGFAARGLKVLMATNNATKSPQAFRQKLLDLGVDVPAAQIINSGITVAHMLHQRYPEGGPVFVVGEQGLVEVLAERGFYPTNENVLAVVAGLDRGLTYDKMRQATLLIRAGAPFYGTNPDRTFPTPYGLVPGAGSVLAMLETAAGAPPILAGKPEPAMYNLALELLGTRPEETLAVGDRLDTDILGAQRAGLRTALVLSGVTSAEEAARWSPQPDLIAPALADL